MSNHRNHLLEIINSVFCHPTAEDVHAIARQTRSKISLGTVYRNLNALVESRQVRRLSVPGMPDRFDRIEPHDHLICRSCGTVVDIAPINCQCTGLPSGVAVESFDVMAHGLCSNCGHSESIESQLK